MSTQTLDCPKCSSENVRLASVAVGHECSDDVLDERRLRDLVQSPTVKVGAEEYQLRLVGLSEAHNKMTLLLAIAIGDIDERLQLQLSEDQRRDPIALRQRIVYFAKRIVTSARRPDTLHVRLAAAQAALLLASADDDRGESRTLPTGRSASPGPPGFTQEAEGLR